MSGPRFDNPIAAVMSGYDFSREMTDINQGFGAVTPLPVDSPVGFDLDSGLTANGFNLSQSAQNIVTDPNASGLIAPAPFTAPATAVATGAGRAPSMDGDGDADDYSANGMC